MYFLSTLLTLTKIRRVPVRLFWLTSVLSACTAAGPIDNPIAGNLTYFSYAAGSDLRASCAAGVDTYRFIYNGRWRSQLRQYDLVVPSAGPAELRAAARGTAGNLANFSLSEPLGPWQLTAESTLVDPSRTAPLLAALAADAAAAPAAPGQRLNSNEFYWLVAACRAGVFTLTPFNDRRIGHDTLIFPEIMLGLDTTGVPFRAARFVEGGGGDTFQLRINAAGNGLVGVK